MTLNSEKKNNFITLVRKKVVKSPTERGFNEVLWSETWKNSSDNQDADKSLYDAGIVFNTLLSELRAKIKELYKTQPNASISQLLRAYCGMANRDRAIIAKPDVNRLFDLFSITTSSNILKNEISHQEIADGCVDSIRCAISATIKKSPETKSDAVKTDAFLFMQNELHISQLYETLEDYWRALVWGEYAFIITDKIKNIYEIRQIASNLTISHESSQIRKIKNAAHAATFLMDKYVLAAFKNDSCVVLRREGKNKKLLVKAIGQLDETYQITNAQFKLQVSYIIENFPTGFLDSDHGNQGFTILDIIDVFRVLVILSEVSLQTFPHNDGVFSLKKATEFSPKITLIELVRGISKATKFDIDKCTKIISFLTFRAERDEDLWCYPIVDLGNNELTYLVAALVSPIMQRVVEHWIVKMKLDSANKGFSYERIVLDAINLKLNKNPIFQDYDPAVSYKFKLAKDRDEEIDLIFRFGRIVIVGEIKSIVTTDSAISLYRTNEIITGAAKQAKRKMQFVSDNSEKVFEKLGWHYNSELKYEFVPLVINSNSICVGSIVNEVPVCDLLIVSKYFSSNIIPLISVDENKHIAWFDIYEDFNEAQSNIKKYLKKPPQISLTSDDFEFKTIRLPVVSEKSPKIQFTRLLKKEVDIANLISREFSFSVSLSSDFRDISKNFDIII